MNELTFIKSFIGVDMKYTLSIGIKMYLLTHRRASSNELADYFDKDFKSIQESLCNLKRGGWVQIVDHDFSHGLAMNSRTGQLTKTNRRCGVYGPTDKLNQVMT